MDKQIRKYAELIVKKGLNINEETNLVIGAPIEVSYFVEIVMEEAYKLGAKKISIDWSNEKTARLKYENEDIENFQSIAEWQISKMNYELDQNTSYLAIKATDPEALKGINPEKVMALQEATYKHLSRRSKELMSDQKSWCVVSVPTVNWSKKVFNNDQDSVNKLWEAILKATYCDLEDPIKKWDDHICKLETNAKKLNDYQFDSVVFENEKGTNIEVGLPKNHIWQSGASVNKTTNRDFIANIPTEEVFTMPDCNNVNGIVHSSKPLNYQGNLIDEFSMVFKDGEVVESNAKVGNEILKELLAIDNGAKKLGEVALVSFNTPISMSDTLFYNTLYDENASNHLALGRAYPTCIESGDKMTQEELESAGVNESAIHVDFMFGTSDMDVFGIKGQERIQIFKDGNFCI